MTVQKKSLLPLLAIFIVFSLFLLYLKPSQQFHPLSSLGYATTSKMPMCIRNTETLDNMDMTETELFDCLQHGEKPSYYLSIVLVTRMDNYAGGQLHRIQNLVDSTFILAERTKTAIELLFIEWNPLSDHRCVIDTLRFRQSPYLSYRIITVPPQLHDAVPRISDTPVHEYEGKNLGIRFARGEFVLCTNQDDIWSHNFHRAISSRIFKNNTIYLQHQDWHDIHQNFPPTIVDLPAFPTDQMIYDSCNLVDNLPGDSEPALIDLRPENIRYIADQAGDFTLAHRDTWKSFRGYREVGGTAWADIEVIATAAWSKNVSIMHSKRGYSCHQHHTNTWEGFKDRIVDHSNVDLNKIFKKEATYMNEEGRWGLLQHDIWMLGLECTQFSGGLCL